MMNDPNDKMLDDLFAQAREVQKQPSNDLMARVLADAAAVQPVAARKTAAKQGLWVQISEAIGGWPALSGLAVATVAGVWIGIAPPSSIEDITASLLGDEVSVDIFSSDLSFVAGDFVDG